ncbi:MAG: prolyl oligopeptidase family serine peptidase [Candidatus Pacebacteria bacterium]|nr:prolyl oligopeptidase family serine peptidase [Candidatus Paceibacterota bacterium]
MPTDTRFHIRPVSHVYGPYARRAMTALVPGFAIVLGILQCAAHAQGMSHEPAARTDSPVERLQAQLQQRIDREKEHINLTQSPGDLPAASESSAHVWTALAGVQVEKARMYLRRKPAGRVEAQRALISAQSLLDHDPVNGLPATIEHGRITELAYFARNDTSPQPYFMYAPNGYDGATPWPLVVFLHGWVPSTSTIDPYLVSDFVLDLADKHRTLLALPHGRTNTDFQFAGEVDVLRVIAEVKKYYNVNPDRVYLLGISMGGAGAWQIGTHYPDLFAGIAPINGQADWFRFWHDNYDCPTRENTPGHLKTVIAMNNPLDLADNLLNLYSYSQHAKTCFLGADHTLDMVEKLKRIGAPHDVYIDPSHLGHYTYWTATPWRKAFEHLLRQTRVSDPREISFSTYSLRFPKSYWVEIKQFLTWGDLATIRATYEGDGRIRVVSKNVAAFRLSPPGTWGEDELTITWNGEILKSLPPEVDGSLHIVWPERATPGENALVKNRAVCGPAPDVFNFPFTVVIGTRGTDTQDKAVRNLAMQFVDDWEHYAEGRPPVVRDVEVTQELMDERGLVLFGMPDTNAVIHRIADSLPFQLSEDTIKLPDGKTFSAQENGLILTYPNPLAPQRYILIYNGLHWGEGRSYSHRFDRLPDFTIFTDRQIPAIGSNAFRAAGFFDAHWKYDPELTDFGP